jgi:purine nucleosidase
VLATGSLTNLYGAYTYNPDFFRQVKKIVLMGGITEPLIFAKRQMDELNFSCDPKATYTVLTSGADVAIATGNNCLKVLFTREEYEREFSDTTKKIVKFIKTETDYWFDDNMNVYGIPGYYNWDVIAAAYLMHPELFIPHRMDMEISEEHLRSGRLDFCEDGHRKNCTLDLPEIGEESAFTKNIYQTWMNVSIE